MVRLKRSIILLLLITLVVGTVAMAETDVLLHNDIVVNRVNKIAFASKRDGNFEIYTINDDGSDLKRLTNSKYDDLKPQWSPDGSKIMYLSKKRSKTAIMVMNRDGSGQRRLVDECAPEYQPLWSPDSSQILFVARSHSQYRIYTVNADGSNLVCLTEFGVEGTEPSWSPDGSRILYIERFQKDTYIYSVKPDGTDRRKVPKEKGVYQSPVWSPDGARIAYLSANNTLLGTYNQIYILNQVGGNPIEIADGSRRVEDINYKDDLYWSPNGTMIAFTKVAEVDARVSESGSVSFIYLYGTYIVGTDGNDHDRLLAKTGTERRPPSWSPDSSRIALVSNSKLLVYNIKTRTDDEISVNVSIPLSPVKWSPDGSKLIFAGKKNSFKKSGLYLVTLDGKVTQLSEANDYDPVWAPN